MPLDGGHSTATRDANRDSPSELNGWDTAAWALEDGDADGLWEGTFDVAELPSGPFGYKVLLNGTEWLLDPPIPERVYVDGIENSRGRIPDCTLPHLQLVERQLDP